MQANVQLLMELLVKNQRPLRLLNKYKGLPISYEATISAVGENAVEVHSNRYQLACLYLQRETYLRAEEPTLVFHSQVTSLQPGKENAVLTDLVMVENGIGGRTEIRVEPDELIMAAVRFDDAPMQIFAPLADISAGGAGVYIGRDMFPSRSCHPGAGVFVSVALPDTAARRASGMLNKPPQKVDVGKVTITARGKVVTVRPYPELEHFRVGMELGFKDLARAVILQYISQRQNEIIRDLGILSNELYRRIG